MKLNLYSKQRTYVPTYNVHALCMKVGIPLKLSEPAWYSATSDYDRASYRREMQMLHHHYFS